MKNKNKWKILHFFFFFFLVVLFLLVLFYWLGLVGLISLSFFDALFRQELIDSLNETKS